MRRVSGGRVGETDRSIVQFGFSLPLPSIDRGKNKRELHDWVIKPELRKVPGVAEAQWTIAGQLKLPEGYSVEWGGQFENLERANRRL